MKRQLFKDGLIYGLGILVVNSIGLVLLPIYARGLKAAELGVFDYINVLFSFVHLFVCLEITQAVAIYYAEASSIDEKRRYASTSIWFSIASYSCFLLISFPFSNPIAQHLLDSNALGSICRLGLVLICLKGFLYVFQNQLRWEMKSNAYTISNIAAVLSAGVFSALGILVWKAGLKGLMIGQCFGHLLGCLFCIFNLRSSLELHWDSAKLKQMLTFSFPLIFSTFALILGSQIDRLLIKGMLSLRELGIYGVGMRLSTILDLALSGFRMGIAPLIYHHYANPKTPSALSDLFRLFVFAGLACVVILVAYSKDLLILVTTPDYYSASSIVPLLALKTMASSLYIFLPGLIITKRMKIFAGLNIVGAFITAAANALFIWRFGLLGGAVAGVLSAFIVYLLHLHYSQKYYRVPFPYKKVSVAAAMALGITIILTSLPITERLNLLLTKSVILGIFLFFLSKLLVEKDEGRKLKQIIGKVLRTRAGT